MLFSAKHWLHEELHIHIYYGVRFCGHVEAIQIAQKVSQEGELLHYWK